MAHNFTKLVRMDPAFTYYAAGTTDCESSVFDMQGYEDITCSLLIGAVTTGATVNLHAEGSTASNGTFVDITGSAAVLGSTQGSSGLYLVSEVFRPLKRYIKFVADRETQNTQLLGGMAFRYRASDLPVDESTFAQASTQAAIIDYALSISGTSGTIGATG